MFSEKLLDHFQHPRNAGELSGATARVEVSNPVCGDILELAVIVETGVVSQARFLCCGCSASIACASLLTEELHFRTTAEAKTITAESLSVALGGLPPATFHGAQLAADALQALIELSRRDEQRDETVILENLSNHLQACGVAPTRSDFLPGMTPGSQQD